MPHTRPEPLPVIAITPGEPAGIGPELVAGLLREEWPARFVVIGDADLLRARAGGLWPARVAIEHVGLAVASEAGRLDRRNAPYVLATLTRAVEGCLSGAFDALVTGPVHKGIMNDAGIAFTGHTEFLAAQAGAALPVMLLTTPGLRVALVTTHMPLRDVAAAVTQTRVTGVLQVLLSDFGPRFALPRPRILVLGLNPHAGESGHLGREEIDVLEPVIQAAREAGADVRGPVPADTAFTEAALKDVDVVLAMYHDQGLAPLKQRGFGNAVNITLGLPFIRTSVDHGTALTLAGTGRADTGSLRAALQTAVDMVRNVRST